jgi:hypothetical protein
MARAFAFCLCGDVPLLKQFCCKAQGFDFEQLWQFFGKFGKPLRLCFGSALVRLAPVVKAQESLARLAGRIASLRCGECREISIK